MRALIRNIGETVLESYGIPCIDWNTGAPLTNPGWSRGPYLLVQDYDPNDEPSPVMVPQSEPEHEIENEDDYVIIDGKRYSKTELRSLIE